MIEKSILVRHDDYVRYGALLGQDCVDLEKEGLEPHDAFCVGSVEFYDGISADLMVCTEQTAVWAEIWWRVNGEVVERTATFYAFSDWFEMKYGGETHRVNITDDALESYFGGMRDTISAWAHR